MAKLGPAIVVAAAAAAAVTAVPDIRVTPLSLSFDQNPVKVVGAAGVISRAAGASSFTIFNVGNSELEVVSLRLDQATQGIEWSPAAPFTVAPGREQRVEVTIDWSRIPAGTTQRRLLLGSNDPDGNLYPSGVELLVVRGPGGGNAPLSGGSTCGGVLPCAVAAATVAEGREVGAVAWRQTAHPGRPGM